MTQQGAGLAESLTQVLRGKCPKSRDRFANHWPTSDAVRWRRNGELAALKRVHEFVDAGHQRVAEQYRRHNQHHKHEEGNQYSGCESSTAKRSLEHLITLKNGNGDDGAPKKSAQGTVSQL